VATIGWQISPLAEHTLPHVPQLAVVATLTHALLQSPWPAGQQLPFVQAPGTPFASGGQVMPQPPQLSESDVVSEHALPHTTSLLGHGAHCEAVQVVGRPTPSTLGTSGHFLPHAPQLRLSDVSSTHAPLQSASPAAQQLPFWQAGGGKFRVAIGTGQTVPQEPQLAGSDERLAQKALAPLPQSVSAAPQQLPFVHVPGAPLALSGQTMPHPPQLFGSEFSSTQALLQSVCPDEQQLPLTQTADPPSAPGGQTLPHAPQFLGSLCRPTHVVPQPAAGANVLTHGFGQPVCVASLH
jgi:hypothetical protein